MTRGEQGRMRRPSAWKLPGPQLHSALAVGDYVIQARETRLTTAADERIYQATGALFVACARHPPHLAIAGRQPRQLVGGIEHESVGSSRRTPAVRGAALTHLRF